MKTKFTKGPWQYTPAGPADSEGMGICAMWGEGEELAANAHLIAAAPEMYEMLECLIERFACYDEAAIEIGKVLEKARGE